MHWVLAAGWVAGGGRGSGAWVRLAVQAVMLAAHVWRTGHPGQGKLSRAWAQGAAEEAGWLGGWVVGCLGGRVAGWPGLGLPAGATRRANGAAVERPASCYRNHRFRP